MKQFIERLIVRLEEKVHLYYKQYMDDIIGYSTYNKYKREIASIIEAVNELADDYEDDCCEWRFTKSVVDGGYFYSSGCSHKRFSDLHSFEFCPYCGKKIKVV